MIEGFDWENYQAAFCISAEAAGFSATVLTTLDNGPMMAWERPGKGPTIYLSAGIHGDEPAGPLAVLALMMEGYFSDAYHWLVCPALNPSGLAAGTRENAEGIDLNRDYWLCSTSEVKAHSAWMSAQVTPDLFISLHEDWETCGFYFYEINLGAEDSCRSQRILDAVSPWFPPERGPEIDGHEACAPGWIYHAAEPDLPEGWPEAIYLAKKGCSISFTFETPSLQPLEARVAAHVAAVKAACEGLGR